MGVEIRKCLQEFKEEQQKIKIMKSKKNLYNLGQARRFPGG
jgi:hypothetical protein